jgi:hypothetical protein
MVVLREALGFLLVVVVVEVAGAGFLNLTSGRRA